MKLIEIEDLEVGDEIIISCQSYFKYLRILRKPAIGTKTHWVSGKPLYKSVKCSTRREEKNVTYTRYNGQSYTRTEKTWGFGPDNHNYEHYVDLSYRQIILVKKNEQ
jgi:hypothetical protein